MQTIARHEAGPGGSRPVPYGALAFFLATVVIVVMLGHHPVAEGARSARESLDLIAQLAVQDGLVHAVLIGAVAMLLYGAVELCLALGLLRAPVAAGLAAYGIGCAFVVGAMLLDGFVTPQAALRLSGRGDALVQAAGASFVVVSSCIQVLTKAGLCGMGAGMLMWSAACWKLPSGRTLGVLGVLAGFLPPLAVALAGMRVQPHLLMLLAAAQGAWNLGAGIYLWKRANAF